MARDRQQAKRRQAERREARLRERRAQGGEAAGDGARLNEAARVSRPERDGDGAEATRPDDAGRRDARVPDPAAEAQLAMTAPPEDAGRSDTVVEAPPPAPHLEEDEHGAPRDRGDGAEKPRGRVLAFLVAVWAELQRVQWPDRKTLTTLTGVVLGFVLIAGGYLGALDAIFSRLIQTIL